MRQAQYTVMELVDKSIALGVEVHGFKSWEAYGVFKYSLFGPILWFSWHYENQIKNK
jgi:hypothetical protein